LVNLEKLYLNYNSLSGSIPREIGFLKQTEELDFSINNLYGTIPSTIGNHPTYTIVKEVVSMIRVAIYCLIESLHSQPWSRFARSL
jgi:hypothetical protein